MIRRFDNRPINNYKIVEKPMRQRMMTVLVGLFIIAATAIASIPGLNYVVKILGLILALAFAFRTLVFRSGFLFTPELILYFCWLIWSLSSIFTGSNVHYFWLSWQGIIQICILILVLSSFCVSTKALSFILASLLLGALVVGVFSFISGEFQRVYAEGGRVQGLLGNANSFGWTMLIAVICMAYFWMMESRYKNLLRIVLFGGFMLATMATILSASRKATIGFILFFLMWILFCYRRQALKRYRLLFGILASLLLGAIVLHNFMQGKTIQERFYTVRYDFDNNVRIYLYLEAAQVIHENPIFGVGLNNFWRFSRWGLPVHSEYAEIAAATGIPGLFIYLSIFVVLWMRAGKIIKHSRDPATVRIADLIRAVLVVIMILNFVTWNYSSKTSWILFSGFIGWSVSTWKSIKAKSIAGDTDFRNNSGTNIMHQNEIAHEPPASYWPKMV